MGGNLPLAAPSATVSTLAMDPLTRARELIDAAHAADPVRAADGRAAELVYAARVEGWVVRLDPAAPAILRLAARCQHLERWLVPRATFPLGKVGYMQWRTGLYRKQAERARALLLEAGVVATDAAEVATWVSKTGLKTNPGTQALEDAACLVFLENEISEFAAQHADYPREKFIEIIRKTWKKMSPSAQQAALGLALPTGIAELVQAAVAG
jgi:tRNAThr (cytosine32-N3)-methyltransferase